MGWGNELHMAGPSSTKWGMSPSSRGVPHVAGISSTWWGRVSPTWRGGAPRGRACSKGWG